MNTLEILKKARKLIAEPEHWIQGEYARDANGFVVPPNSDYAVCFCVLGAVSHVLNRGYPLGSVIEALVSALPKGYDLVSVFNDEEGRTHAEVLALFDKAICLEEAKVS